MLCAKLLVHATLLAFGLANGTLLLGIYEVMEYYCILWTPHDPRHVSVRVSLYHSSLAIRRVRIIKQTSPMTVERTVI